MHWNYMRFPHGKTKALTFSYDDGVEQDARLLELFEKYKVKGTFNLNSGMYPDENFTYPPEEWHRRNKKNVATKLYSKPWAEVASHTYTHAHIAELPLSVVVSEFIKDREVLENQFQRLVIGACYPYNCDGEKEMLAASAAGIEYARGNGCTYDFCVPNNWLRWKPTCHHNYSGLSKLAQKFVEDKVIKEPYIFYVWGHSYEFTKDNNWDTMENLLRLTANHADVWYATNGDIYDYVTAYRNLKYTCDGGMVFNPSAVTVYLEIDFKPLAVHPQETLLLGLFPMR